MLRTTADMLMDKKKIILVHGNADMDAFGSAYALSKCFPPAAICAPGGMDRVAKSVAERMGAEVLSEYTTEGYDLTVVVDTSSPEQFSPGIVEVPGGSIVIDHHRPTGKWEGMHFLCDDSKVSCAELIYDVIKAAEIEVDRGTALTLLGGMLTDSGHFQYADPKLMMTFAEILEHYNIHMDEAMSLTKNEQSMSERVAVMKTIGGSRFDRVGDMVVAVAEGKSYESASCKALMTCGADVVFVASQRDEEFRLSARASQEMIRRGIHLGDILKGLGEETSTDGGGHGGAAGMSGIGDVEAMLHMCMKRTMHEFREIKKRSDLS